MTGYLEELYHILCVHLGEPPAAFDWGFYASKPDGDGGGKAGGGDGNDGDGAGDGDGAAANGDGEEKKKKKGKKTFVCVRGLTPQAFLKDHVPLDIGGHVSLIHDPRNEYYKLYTVRYLGPSRFVGFCRITTCERTCARSCVDPVL